MTKLRDTSSPVLYCVILCVRYKNDGQWRLQFLQREGEKKRDEDTSLVTWEINGRNCRANYIDTILVVATRRPCCIDTSSARHTWRHAHQRIEQMYYASTDAENDFLQAQIFEHCKNKSGLQQLSYFHIKSGFWPWPGQRGASGHGAFRRCHMSIKTIEC